LSDLRKLSIGQRLKFLAKDSAIYGLAGALNKGFALITFPLLARHFSVEDFGLIDYLNTLVVLFVTFLVFGQDSAVARFFYEHNDDANRRQVISQSLFLQATIVLGTIPLVWIWIRPLSEHFIGRSNGTTILALEPLPASDPAPRRSPFRARTICRLV